MTKSDLELLLEHFNAGWPVGGESELHKLMHYYAQQALIVTAKINSGYKTAEELCKLMSELTGRKVPDSFRLFPPFYCEFGKNLHIGENVFINASCCFQDHGGIYIDDGALIGHAVVIATINHGKDPRDRASNYPAPVYIGKKVWIGAHATILPGVTIGENAIVAAGAVVNRDVPDNTIVAGVPARHIGGI